jgi:hypothetical protein
MVLIIRLAFDDAKPHRGLKMEYLHFKKGVVKPMCRIINQLILNTYSLRPGKTVHIAFKICLTKSVLLACSKCSPH